MAPDNEPTVSSIILDTVTRLEANVNAGFAAAAAKLDQKADKSDITALSTRLDGYGQRLEHTEATIRDQQIAKKTQEQVDTEHKDKRQGRFNVSIAALSCAALIVSVILGVVH